MAKFTALRAKINAYKNLDNEEVSTAKVQKSV